jgi:hypothetical protein
VARDDARTDGPDWTGLVGAISRDAERLWDQHVALLRTEMREGLRQVPPAAASVGAGAGLLATAGVLGALMLVHGLHRSTRIPLWGCYGLVGAAMAAAGAGLVAQGARQITMLSLVPRETVAALREDLEWVKGQTTLPNGPS